MSIIEPAKHALNFFFFLRLSWFSRVRFKAEERALGALYVLLEACQLRLYFVLLATRAPLTDLGPRFPLESFWSCRLPSLLGRIQPSPPCEGYYQ